MNTGRINLSVGVFMEKERRFSSRLDVVYPARLWGSDPNGGTWIEDAIACNISSGGVYLKVPRMIERQAHLSIAVRLSTAPPGEPALRLVARGVVLRTQRRRDGYCEAAIEFTRRRVL
jgi:hypothetical protein